MNTFNLFAQDAWQITKKLSLNFGVRYDYLGPMHNDRKDLSVFLPDKGGLLFQGAGISSLYPQDWNNFAPRLGFAYRVKENSDLVVRGSFGVFYDTPNLNPFLDNRPPNGAPNGVQGNPAGSTPVSTIEADNYAIPTDGSYIFPGTGPTCQTGTGCGSTIYNIFSVSQNFRTAYFYNYNLNIEKGLGRSAVFQIGYVGSEGRKLLTISDINQPTPADDPDGLTKQQRRPYYSQFPNFGIINEINSTGNSTPSHAEGQGVASGDLPVRLHMGPFTRPDDGLPRRDAAGQFQPQGGLWEQRLRRTTRVYRSRNLRSANTVQGTEIVVGRVAAKRFGCFP